MITRQRREEHFTYEVFGPGTETFYVGRYVHHEGFARNHPTARFGNLAAMPNEPVELRDLPPQEAFLMEARSLGGYSGSPVFVLLQNFIEENGDVLMLTKGVLRLIGVHCGQLDDEYPVLDKKGERTGLKAAQKSGMMVVIPFYKVRDMLSKGPLMDEREREVEEQEERNRRAGGSAESADPGDDEPFTRDAFMAKLRKVTKRDEPQSEEG
jgi:hypothetical protein